MSILKNSVVAGLFLFSVSALAQSSPVVVSVIGQGSAVASIALPASAKVQVEADHSEHHAGKTVLKGNAKLTATSPSGEVVRINAEELEISDTAIGTEQKK